MATLSANRRKTNDKKNEENTENIPTAKQGVAFSMPKEKPTALPGVCVSVCTDVYVVVVVMARMQQWLQMSESTVCGC